MNSKDSEEFTLQDQEDMRILADTKGQLARTRPLDTWVVIRLFRAYQDLLCQQFPIKVPLRRPGSAINRVLFSAETNGDYQEASASLEVDGKVSGEVFFTVDPTGGFPIVYIQTGAEMDEHTMVVRLDGKNYENGKPYKYNEQGI